MASHVIFVLCAFACFMQCINGQCIGCAGIGGAGFLGAGLAASGLAYDGLALGGGCGGVASIGGGFPVTSSSPVAPTGLNVVSENLYEGALLVEGNLPLLGSVGLEGALGTAGAGAVSYGCGDGAIGIAVEEGPIVTGILAPGPVGPGLSAGALGLAPGLGYGSGLAYGPGLIGAGIGAGCGCGVY